MTELSPKLCNVETCADACPADCPLLPEGATARSSACATGQPRSCSGSTSRRRRSARPAARRCSVALNSAACCGTVSFPGFVPTFLLAQTTHRRTAATALPVPQDGQRSERAGRTCRCTSRQRPCARPLPRPRAANRPRRRRAAKALPTRRQGLTLLLAALGCVSSTMLTRSAMPNLHTMANLGPLRRHVNARVRGSVPAPPVPSGWACSRTRKTAAKNQPSFWLLSTIFRICKKFSGPG